MLTLAIGAVLVAATLVLTLRRAQKKAVPVRVRKDRQG
jgi:hypothetical protein